MDVSKQFRRAWRRHRKLPQLYAAKSLRITPEHQFISELLVSVGSWNRAELTEFIDEMGYECPREKGILATGILAPSILALTNAAKFIINDVFDAWDDGVGILCNVDMIHKVLRINPDA